MVKSNNVRASGKTTATEVADKLNDTADDLHDETLPEDTEVWFSTFGLSRIRTEWRSTDAATLQRVKQTVEDRLVVEFSDVYAIMSDLYDVVREPEVNMTTGEITVVDGLVVWARSPATGAYVEDWSRLTIRQKEDFLYRITTNLFEWTQRAADLHLEAMFAKGQWTEKFATEFDSPVSGTVEDRTARGNVQAAEERYFAIYLSGLSRRADALIRVMEALALRLRDTL